MTTKYNLGNYAARLPLQFVANFGGRFELVGFRPMTAHPDDGYLFVVIGKRSDDTFAKWTYNAEHAGFHGGHYDLTLREALDLIIRPESSLASPDPDKVWGFFAYHEHTDTVSFKLADGRTGAEPCRDRAPADIRAELVSKFGLSINWEARDFPQEGN